jgi:hypothetical protein
MANLKMEKICSSETSVDFQRTTRRCVPEYSILRNNRCDNLKSYIIKIVCEIEKWMEQAQDSVIGGILY